MIETKHALYGFACWGLALFVFLVVALIGCDHLRNTHRVNPPGALTRPLTPTDSNANACNTCGIVLDK